MAAGLVSDSHPFLDDLLALDDPASDELSAGRTSSAVS
jgi:hypothetical protein